MARTVDQRTYFLEQAIKIIMHSRLTGERRSPPAQHALLTTMERSGNFSEGCIATLRSLVDSLKGSGEYDSTLSIADNLLAELAEATTEEEKKAILIRVVNDWIKTSRVTGNHRTPANQHSLITTMGRSGKVDGQLTTTLRSLIDPQPPKIDGFHYTLADNSLDIQLPAIGERVTIYQLQQTPDGKQVMVPIVMKLKYQTTVPTATVQAQPSYQFYQEISTSIGNQLQPISMIQSGEPGIFFWPQDSNGTSNCGWVARVGVLRDQFRPLTPIFYTPKDKAEELKWENAFFSIFGMPPIASRRLKNRLQIGAPNTP